MFYYLQAFAVLLLSSVLVMAQDQPKRAVVSLEDWDVGAVRVVAAPQAPAAAKQPTGAKGRTQAQRKADATQTRQKSKLNTERDGAPQTASQKSNQTLKGDRNEVVLAARPTDQTKPVQTGRPELDKIIQNASQESGVDPQLIYSVMRQESAFKPLAVSHKGARGLMQLIPATARRFGVKNIFDPQENVRGGAKYLKFLLDKFNGDVELALAGYNAGEGAVMRYGYRIPPYSETRNYVRSIMSKYEPGNYPRAETRIVPAGIAGQAFVAPPIVLISDSGTLTLSNNY